MATISNFHASDNDQHPVCLPVTRGKLASFPQDPIACIRQLYRSHGTIAALEEGSQRFVFVCGPEYNKQVLTDPETFHAHFFAIRGPRKSAQRRLTSNLLSMNGEKHKRHRRLLMEPFMKLAIATYHGALETLAREMLDGWQVGQVRDLHDDMTQFMLRVTSTILFGFDQSEFSYRLGHMIDRWVEMNHRIGVGAMVADDTFSDEYGDLLEFAELLEVQIRAMIELRRSSDAGGNDVMSILIRSHDDQGGLSDEDLIGHAALLFSAAHMTTAHSLSWTLFLLAQHPQVMSELFTELSGKLHGLPPQPEQLESLPVLERVIKESMRVLPASSYSQRINSRPVDLGPFHLESGTPVMFSQYMTHHMPELFPQPERFWPDRWLQITPSPYAYLPFAAGPRLCIGGPLALMILKTVLPAILQRFRLSLVPGVEINGNVISTMLTPTTPIPMLLSPPDGRFHSSPITGNLHSMVDMGKG